MERTAHECKTRHASDLFPQIGHAIEALDASVILKWLLENPTQEAETEKAAVIIGRPRFATSNRDFCLYRVKDS
jgi:hypothetical protein